MPYGLSAQYLGLTLDRRLWWHEHVASKTSKAKRPLNALLSATRGNWGPRPRIAKWVYTSMVRPSVSYSAAVWAHEISLQKARRCLDGLDRLALRSISHSAHSSPTPGLAVLMNLLPISHHLQQTAMHSALRHPILTELDWPSRATTKRHCISHRAHWSALFQQMAVSPTTDYLRTVNPLPTFRMVRESFTGHPKFRHPSQITIFTDGSRMHDRVGTGYVLCEGAMEYDTGSYSLPSHSTVFQAELTAILLAARHVLREARSLRPKYVKILSDSRSALLALSARRSSCRTTLDLSLIHI